MQELLQTTDESIEKVRAHILQAIALLKKN